ncbi:hypothetical protein KC344_g72 [Hortaea werneckii]|nr:hypothetical protein KC344_g72 [Hortaea werneckii]
MLVLRSTARVKKKAMSAIPSLAIQSTSNSLKPALAEVMILHSGARWPSKSLSKGSYGGVPIRMMKASIGPCWLMSFGNNCFVCFLSYFCPTNFGAPRDTTLGFCRSSIRLVTLLQSFSLLVLGIRDVVYVRGDLAVTWPSNSASAESALTVPAY